MWSEPRRTAALLIAAILGTFASLRTMLWFRPNADLDVAGYNVHHLFTGLLIATICVVPLLVAAPTRRARDVLTVGFGVGLAMALDEWVYLIATDGSNASYLLPVSLRGGAIVVGLTCAYVALVAYWSSRR